MLLRVKMLKIREEEEKDETRLESERGGEAEEWEPQGSCLKA